jgi:hypothetical protein
MVDREGTAAAADAHGLFVVGMDLAADANPNPADGASPADAPEAEDG